MTAAEVRAIVLDLIYPLPNELDSLEANERFHHRDLGRRPGLSRRGNANGSRQRLTLEEEPDAWLLTRYAKLGEALDRAR